MMRGSEWKKRKKKGRKAESCGVKGRQEKKDETEEGSLEVNGK